MKKKNLLILLFILIIIFGFFYPNNIFETINLNHKQKLLQEFEILYFEVGQYEKATKTAKKYDRIYKDIIGKTLLALSLERSDKLNQSYEIIDDIDLIQYCDLTYFTKSFLEYRLYNNSNILGIVIEGLNASDCLNEEFELKYLGDNHRKLELVINFLIEKEEYNQINLLFDFIENNESNYKINKAVIAERKGYILFKQEDYDNASFYFTESIKYNLSTYSCPFGGLGMLYFYSNDSKRAKTMLEKATLLNDTTSDYYIALAKIYYAEGRIDEAKSILYKSIRVVERHFE
ncbi:hypothetical protein HOD20_07765 [archaeon]|jgi:tetratricopeptide (TPR) repeat protein|nr:hypothetical protein [archaeon]